MSKTTLKLESIILTSVITSCITIFVMGNLVTFINVEQNVSKQNKLRPFLLNLQHHFSHHGLTNLGAKLRHYIDEKEELVTDVQSTKHTAPTELYSDYSVTFKHKNFNSSNDELKADITSKEGNDAINKLDDNSRADTEFSVKDSVYVKGYVDGCDITNRVRIAENDGEILKPTYYFNGDILTPQKAFIVKGNVENILRIYNNMRLYGVKLKYTTFMSIYFYAEKSRYLNVVNNISSGNTTNSVGVYFHSLKEAYVLARVDDNETLKTTTHEVVHGMVAQNMGVLPVALNEGLATYLSAIRRNDNQPTEVNAINWYEFSSKNYQPLKFYEVFSKDRKQWRAHGVRHNYASSWVWVAYLFENPKTRTILANALNQKIANPCMQLDIDALALDFLHVSPFIEYDFEQWFKARTKR
ncbi:hypothetical protein AAEU28_10985 [Pseudoalteromonas sp. SS15]|uniref:hypothetical protein n=1 Tax=Pseudoalteromonas sp. SS15 TaxID=3139393 RepID=UPI003BAAC0AD